MATPTIARRRSVRFPGHDYSDSGVYFVTICAWRRACHFGEVSLPTVRLSPIGHIVDSCWKRIPEHFAHVALDAHILMPDHLHGILKCGGCAASRGPDASFGQPVPGSLATVIRSFKAAATRAVRLQLGDPAMKLWQRGFHEHVIRNEMEVVRLREYIAGNPARWAAREQDGE
jgi:putative transposase